MRNQFIPSGCTKHDITFLWDGLGPADWKTGRAFSTITCTNSGIKAHGGLEQSFNGTNQVADIDLTVTGTGDYTYCLWTTPGDAGASTYALFDDSKTILLCNTDDTYSFSRNGGTTYTVSGASAVTRGASQFVAVTSTAASPSLTNIYINGVLSGTANQSAGNPASGGALHVGGSITGNYKFKGNICPIIFFKKILSVAQIQELYNYHNK